MKRVATQDSKHEVTKSSANRGRTPLGSRDANRVAAAILEVLAGVRTPTDAAQALAVSIPRYYQLEQRALEGLIAACEPRRLGRVQTSESRVSALEKEVQRWQQDCARQQALVRAAQRSIGLAAPAAKAVAKTSGQKTRKRRPTVRALRAAKALRAAVDTASPANSSGAAPTSGLQPLAGGGRLEAVAIHG
ncbi:MAG: hypothetical protein ACRDQZ_20055 [Mycobacteriales bacterium]